MKSFLSVVAGAISLAAGALAEQQTHEFYWNLQWKTVNPDGLADRLVVSFNDSWPLPVIRVNKGDRIVAHVTNGLQQPYRNSSIHWHGMFQNGTTDMDGPVWLTQCPGAPNTTFTYNFTVDQNGTYWYHAHVDNLYPDGYRQMLIVDNDEPWFEDQVDEEISFTVSEWYHELTQDIADTTFMSLFNPTGAEPIPGSILLNDTQNMTFNVKPNTTYRLRIANTGAFTAFLIYMKGVNLTVVEADGVYTKPSEVEVLHIAAAQRYSVLFTTGPEEDAAYQFVQIADSTLFDTVPPELQLNLTHWFVTSDKADKEWVTPAQIMNETFVNQTQVAGMDPTEITPDNFNYFDDATLVPYDEIPLLQNPTKNVTLHLTLTNLLNGKNYAFFNDISWTHAKVPALYSVLSAPDDDTASNVTIFGDNTHTEVLEYMEVVQLVMNNDDGGQHPFHLHGHTFQVALRAPPFDDEFTPYDPEDPSNVYYDPPMRRDVLVVKPNSHFVIRWMADNPGVWFFHCHIDWHLTQGLAMQFVEAPAQIRQNFKDRPIPEENFNVCKLSGLPDAGNAAANTKDFLNLSGANLQVKDLPNGFTARGIVALVFSTICAFIGMGFLIWYGMSDTSEGEALTAEGFLNERVPEEDVQSVQYDNPSHPHPDAQGHLQRGLATENGAQL